MGAGPIDRAREIVFEYVKPRLEKTDAHVTFAQDEVYVVWFCYILGGWKALVSTTLPPATGPATLRLACTTR